MQEQSAANMEASRRKTRKEGKISKEEYETGSRLYFESIKKLPTLFIEAKKASQPCIYLDIRNLIVLLIYETFRLEKWVKLKVICKQQTDDELSEENTKNNLVTLKLKSSLVFEGPNELVSVLVEDVCEKKCDSKIDSVDILNGSRRHPSISVEDKKLIICGLSSVLRFIFKFVCHKIEEDCSPNNEDKEIHMKLKQFLGFRGGCLQACAESSIWTRFCEVDMINSVNDITKLVKSASCETRTNVKASENVKRFENHLSLPVKIHNFQRVVQDVKKANTFSFYDSLDDLSNAVEEKVSISDLKHEFAEGPTLLLSDLILFPSFHVFVLLLGRETFKSLFPKTWEWHDKVLNQFSSKAKLEIVDVKSHGIENVSWSIPEVPVQSLYLRDTNRYKPALRQFTRQYEVEEALECSKLLNITSLVIQEEDPNFKWEEVPLLAHPEAGNLPVSRQQRKCDQLGSMVTYALHVYSQKKQRFNQISKRRFRIVDFCSGGGHVGILLAWFLPDCDVILVENKDESLRRAQERVSGLGLSNVFFYQSNLDYFESPFDLGMALHACGTATDLVISKCVKVNASFVCCPCCYGAVQENHILTYPRSTIFQKLSLRHYLVMCHASDQTQAKEKTVQGKQCMALVDTDRCLYAAENRYDVKLCKIVPETASPKNHILVAISSV